MNQTRLSLKAKNINRFQRFALFIGRKFGITVQTLRTNIINPLFQQAPLTHLKFLIRFRLLHSSQLLPVVNHPAWKNSDERTRFSQISVFISNLNSSGKTLMLISIDISLTSMHLHIGLVENDENKLRILIDASAAMNIGKKGCHQ